MRISLKPLDSKGNYSAISNNTKLVHWPLMGRLLHLIQRGGAWVGCGPAQSPPSCTKCNSPPINGQCIPITVLMYRPLLWGFVVAIKDHCETYEFLTIFSRFSLLSSLLFGNVVLLPRTTVSFWCKLSYPISVDKHRGLQSSSSVVLCPSCVCM